MHYILDLDLDFFVWPIEHDRPEDSERLSDAEFQPSSVEQVRHFLEQQCHLSTGTLIPGRAVVHHVEAFGTWREWIDRGLLEPPFTVFHVDAHSDLGSGGIGNTSPKFIETELMALPIAARRYPRGGNDALNSGNYLLAAIANEWIQQLTYVYPTHPNPPDLTKIPAFAAAEKLRRFLSSEEDDANHHPVGDLPGYCFKDCDPQSRTIQLKHFSRDQYSSGRYSEPMHVGREIPFTLCIGTKFDFVGFSHMIVAQSPAYTPAATDTLLHVIQEYFIPT